MAQRKTPLTVNDDLIYSGQGDSRHCDDEEATNILTAQDDSDRIKPRWYDKSNTKGTT